MKGYVDGILIEQDDATPEELASWEQGKANANSEPTPEERIAALEQELKAAKILLGLED